MKDVIRIALVLYLGCCFALNLLALPIYWQTPNLSVYAFSALVFAWLAGALFMILDSRIGRWIAILSQVPQVIGFAAPGYYYCMFSGFIAKAGFSILPDGNHWACRSESEFRVGSSFGLIGSSHTGTGYYLAVNFGALLVGLIVYYGLRDKKPNPSPQPSVGG